MDALEQRGLAWIEAHQDDLVALLQRFVAVPSLVGTEGACQAVVADAMRGCCDAVDVWEPDRDWLDAHPAFFQKGTEYAGRPTVVGVSGAPGAGDR